MSTTKDRSLDLTGLKSAVQNVAKEHGNLVRSLEDMKRRREDIAAAPANRADLASFVEDWVDGQSSAYSAALRRRLQDIGRRAENLEGGVASVPAHFVRLLGIDVSPHARADVQHVQPEAVLLMLGPEHVKDTFRKVIEALDIPNEGLPLAQRKLELGKLDKQIGEAEEQLGKLRREAADAGIHLDLEVAA